MKELDGLKITKEVRREPDVQIDIYLVEYGYQVDIKLNQDTGDSPDSGWTTWTECRDFGDSYNIEDLKRELVQLARDMMGKFREDK
ncbi:hypothetical protein LCGC14_1858060 [marine sediment metagenome]|uniref:Uncharacterized protein n=1 Tax=marine sediment metagenome TaxID=412755 RepID=A0A0F9IMS1_9ZZZZ